MGNQGPHAGRAMTDPRLNSMHLDLRRREDFRKARSELLQSCGEQTQQAIEIQEPADPTKAPKPPCKTWKVGCRPAWTLF